jgi:hypothetical protein
VSVYVRTTKINGPYELLIFQNDGMALSENVCLTPLSLDAAQELVDQLKDLIENPLDWEEFPSRNATTGNWAYPSGRVVPADF